MKLQIAVTLALVIGVTAACEPRVVQEALSVVTVERFTVGDTTVIISKGKAPTQRVDSVRVLWGNSPLLKDPRSMAKLGDRLIVADPTRLHAINLRGGAIESMGREGGGPGEFRNLSAVAVDGLTTWTFDAELLRLSVFDNRSLKFVRSMPMTPASVFVNPLRPRDTLRRSGAIFTFRREGIKVDSPTRTALIRYDADGQAPAILRIWPDLDYTRLPMGVIGPRSVLGPRAILAVSADAREVAYGQGLDYCVTIETLPTDQAARTVERACRAWEPIRVGRGIRSPDFSKIENEREGQVLQAISRVQVVPTHLPSFDELRYDAYGRLWIRTLGKDLAEIHPALLSRFPELGPDYRSWDVFGQDRDLKQTIELPAGFDPQVILEDEAYGFFEWRTGEIVIAVIRWMI